MMILDVFLKIQRVHRMIYYSSIHEVNIRIGRANKECVAHIVGDLMRIAPFIVRVAGAI